ncbi:MAG: bifunctional folylpolyglutamate synthase/dihydrofolate synthase, partial [Alphaproteobacteria bacterium]
SLVGTHQPRNAALALAVLDHMDGFQVPPAARALGVRSADWPARLQRLRQGPLLDLLPDGWQLWLDGGHNEAAAKTLRSQTRSWRDKPLHMVMGMLNSKDPEVFLKHLEARLGLFRGVAIPGEGNSFSADDVTAAARTWRMQAEPSASVAEAITDIVGTSATPARILISGSLYLAGTILVDHG